MRSSAGIGARRAPLLGLVGAAALVAFRVAPAQSPSLADYFGFDPLEVVKIDSNPGPLAIADVDGDGFNDIVVANNRKSRIEIHYFKPNAKPDDEPTRKQGVNDIPENWRYKREFVSVSHQVTALALHDVDGDGKLDIVYAGKPPSLVVMRQTAPRTFEVARRHTVKDLGATRDGFAIADMVGDQAPELIALAGGKIRIWPLNQGNLGPSIDLAGGGNVVAFILEDFDGDGTTDIVGVIPDDPAPLRVWLAGGDPSNKAFGPQLRYETPPLREVAPIRLPHEKAARLGFIEAASKRLVVNALEKKPVDAGSGSEAALRVYAFRDGANKKRSTAITDVDGDGLLDLVATDVDGNAVLVYRQVPGKGLEAATSYPAFAEMTYLAAGNVDADAPAEVFVLSEKEGVVGRMEWSAEGAAPGLGYPKAVSITPGHTPVAINLVELVNGAESEGRLAVVAKDGRNYAIDLIDPANNTSEKIDLGSQSRSPETIVALDADQDGRTDLLLFTPEKPMTMLRAEEKGFKLLESKDMGQFGLVQAADSRNTETFDIDGDGKPELLIADRNYIRAVRYDAKPPGGASPGWQVVAQINADDPASKLVSLAIRGSAIVAADKENSRLVTFRKVDGRWKQTDSVDIRGFKFNSIQAGAFSGDGQENILAIGDDGFAVIRLGGDRYALEQVAAWRTDIDKRREHEMACGDVNNDGFADLVLLDDGEQMCEILTFSEAEKLLYATGFETFESKVFSGGDARESQPSEVFIADVTGDGLPDIVLVAHDRLLIYPQMKK
ncbi:MAG: VCBS repeat-containing protein [Phycisphaerales bacterium]